MVEKEWTELSRLMASGQDLVVTTDCDCEVLLRFGIPCQHHLRRAFLENSPIPKTLLHPRWWLNGPDILSTNWVPFYPITETVPRPFIPTPMSLDLAQIRAQLQPEELRRFEAQMSRVEASIEEFQAQQTANLLRIG